MHRLFFQFMGGGATGPNRPAAAFEIILPKGRCLLASALPTVTQRLVGALGFGTADAEGALGFTAAGCGAGAAGGAGA